MKKRETTKTKPAATSIEGRTRDVEDWRVKMLDQLRGIILKADPEIIEERKWVKPTNPLGVPTWSSHGGNGGIICTGETYKQVVKLTFAKGAGLKDPAKLFNASLEGNTRRAIDFCEGEKIDAAALRALVREAVGVNSSAKGSR